MNRYLNTRIIAGLTGLFALFAGCNKHGTGTSNTPIDPPLPPSGISYWLTTGDKNNLLTKQTTPLDFSSLTNTLPTINVDSTQTFQTIDGFGYTLTSGSAEVINQLDPAGKNALLNELFGNGENSLGINFLRIGIGATDLSAAVYSYDDMPAGQTDPALLQFSLSPDQAALIPLLKQIVLINPSIRLLATPWSAPAWMKDNNNSIGGSLIPGYYQVYANYFVKYIQAMQAEGLMIYAITPQNEPLHPGNNPSMYMTAAQQALFIKNHLGPSFNAAGITAKIIIYDHNCDRPDYPLDILNDAAARQYIDGSAFHLYAGNITVLSQVYTAFPDKHIYFTEQYTSSNSSFSGDLVWHLRNVIIGSMRNYSRVALEWNLATNPAYGPHTSGGCTICLGALTIGSGMVTRNVSYYIIAQVSRFIPAGSVRIASDNYGNLYTAAFLRPDGKKVMIVLNDAGTTQQFNIKFKNKMLATVLPGNSAATYIW
ncbi:MAG TPA: glycoside hydrolase family 30 beta sandwich domain-containing protein [Chitinophagaceae bacterium]|nr:glycoside hydrolase family 30 beta sandwich domain-containing protein [Chitinophagaceae bacterium]